MSKAFSAQQYWLALAHQIDARQQDPCTLVYDAGTNVVGSGFSFSLWLVGVLQNQASGILGMRQ